MIIENYMTERHYNNQNHVLHAPPDVNSHRYSLRPQQHSFSLFTKTNHRNFMIILLFVNNN